MLYIYLYGKNSICLFRGLLETYDTSKAKVKLFVFGFTPISTSVISNHFNHV